MPSKRRSARLKNQPPLEVKLQMYGKRKLGDQVYVTTNKDLELENLIPKKRDNKTDEQKNDSEFKTNDTDADYSSLFNGISNGHIKTKPSSLMKRPPRSKANNKFKDVYKASPPLRNVSPPRFTTGGVPKSKLEFEKIGVTRLGKVSGNPYSKYRQRRNNILYGNKELNDDDEARIKKLDQEMKKIISDQTGINRKSSSVNIPMLQKVKKELGIPLNGSKNKKAQEDIVDIESLEEGESEENISTKSKRCGRKPGKTVLQCGFCEYKTTHSGHMKVHIMSVHEQTKKYKCTYEACEYECTRKGSMVRHEKCVHRKDLLYECPRENCEFKSAWTKSLERHIAIVHERMRPWKCNLCDFEAGQQYTLQLHVESLHKKLKTVRCAFCEFRSTAKNIVKTHILKCHKDLIENN